MTITPRDIEDRLEEAALTLRRLPHPPGTTPKGYGNAWPEYVRDPRHAYGYHETPMRVVPSPRDIQRMEECLDWLRLIDPEDARILWLRADGARWRQVCIRAGCTRATAWRRWAAALVTIARRLAHGNVTRGGKRALAGSRPQPPAADDAHAPKPARGAPRA